MNTATLIPVSEYLQTTYRPDRDYVDGELKERNAGEQPHAYLQTIIASIFHGNRKSWRVRILTEQRLQVYSDRYRIPDLCVLRNTDPKDLIVSFPPLLCIELLSREDTFIELQDRVGDYVQMGVQNIWAIDPWKRRGYDAGSRGFERAIDGVLQIEGTPILVNLAELFAEADEF